MDAFLFMVLTIVLVIKTLNSQEETTTTLAENNVSAKERVVKLNDSFYEDTNAFSEIINALGFPKR